MRLRQRRRSSAILTRLLITGQSDPTSEDPRHTTGPEMDVELGERARGNRVVVLLREALSWDYAAGSGSSKSWNWAGSAMPRAARIARWPGVVAVRLETRAPSIS